jgi:hypothetical protein
VEKVHIAPGIVLEILKTIKKKNSIGNVRSRIRTLTWNIRKPIKAVAATLIWLVSLH